MENYPVCHAGGREFESRPSRHFKAQKRLICSNLRVSLFLGLSIAKFQLVDSQIKTITNFQ